MKTFKLAAFLSLLAASSITFATTLECQLGNYCPLFNGGDVASFPVAKSIANDYNCIFSGGVRKGKHREIFIHYEGSGAYTFAPIQIRSKEGVSVKTLIKGSFTGTDPKAVGKIIAARLIDSAKKPNDVMVLCDK